MTWGLSKKKQHIFFNNCSTCLLPSASLHCYLTSLNIFFSFLKYILEHVLKDGTGTIIVQLVHWLAVMKKPKILKSLTIAWKTWPECCVEFPSSVENIANNASSTSCRNFTVSAPSTRVNLESVSPMPSGADRHRNKDNRSTERDNIYFSMSCMTLVNSSYV